MATYCLFVAAATLIADMPGAHPIGLQGVLGGAVLASVAGTLGAAAYRHRGATAGLVRLVGAAPGPLHRWVAPAVVALGVQLAASGVLLAVMLALGRGRVLALHHALGPGIAGSAVLTLAQVLLVPNLVIWTSAVLAGPGFAVGSGAWIDLTSSRLGSLPAVPVLGALPGDGPLPVAALALLAVPLAAGAVAGVLVARPAAGLLEGRRRRRRRGGVAGRRGAGRARLAVGRPGRSRAAGRDGPAAAAHGGGVRARGGRRGRPRRRRLLELAAPARRRRPGAPIPGLTPLPRAATIGEAGTVTLNAEQEQAPVGYPCRPRVRSGSRPPAAATRRLEFMILVVRRGWACRSSAAW